ncbi:hypothetical protein NXV02_25435 [Bacteroides ovatus]|nr:hypothetical protein [Bacteroides ovatus]
MKKTMKNDSCLTVSRRAAIIRQDAEENYGTLLTLGESMRRAYQVEELIDRMRWDNADFCLQRTDGTCLSITGTLTEYEHYFTAPTTKTPPTGFSHTMTCIVENGLRVEWQGLYSALL